SRGTTTIVTCSVMVRILNWLRRKDAGDLLGLPPAANRARGRAPNTRIPGPRLAAGDRPGRPRKAGNAAGHTTRHHILAQRFVGRAPPSARAGREPGQDVLGLRPIDRANRGARADPFRRPERCREYLRPVWPQPAIRWPLLPARPSRRLRAA